ncbi:hypothetical protein FEM48_Zijuj01G0061700 [Ziziphus jujuba var. spinosa]|uniref:Uncharacterized protein n=1 Tax=Ziziphus jujuba var. spinosa TaxID=714518 RepID=A0A978VZK6_ZIZJJ|nr:hypothetical protein FEM48_Zijuj01G0061700 [Ziziphus jujuba var. spinosa]
MMKNQTPQIETGEEEEGMKKKKRVVVESLGWLTESSIMPKKHRAITGVGASSIMDLKAQLYKSQEDSKKSKELSGPDLQFQRAKMKIVPHDSFSAKNSGVDARALKDKLELKAVNDGSASYAALEKKAEIYDKLMRGELSDEEEQEKYCVDFFGKRIEQDQVQQTQQNEPSAAALPGDEDSEGDAPIHFNLRPAGLGRAAATMDDDEHKRFVRQEQAAARREKLKQAYLRKQLEKLKSASSTEKT